MAAPIPPLLGNDGGLQPAQEVDALRAAAWMSVTGEVDSRQLQALSGQVHLLNQWVRFLAAANINWQALPIVAGQAGPGGAAPPPPPSWPPR
jgi:hypothetical protein